MGVGALVSLGCLYFATRGTDWGAVSGVLTGASPLWTAAVIGVAIVSFWVRALRWCVLLRPVGDVPTGAAFSATVIGFAASAVLPFRLGEIVRPALLGRRVGISMSAALSSVVLERLFDILFVILCFLLLSVIYQVPDALRQSAGVLAVGAAGGFAVLVIAQRQRERAQWLIRRILDRLPAPVGRTLGPIANGLLSGLAGLSDLTTVALVLVYSAVLWAVIAATYLFSFLALNIEVPLLAGALAAMVTVAAFVFLPQAPGFVGTWQAGCVLALGLFGVSKEVAVGYSLLTWTVQMVVNIGVGGIALAREDLSLRQLVATRTESA